METDVWSVSLPTFARSRIRDGDRVCGLLLTRGVALLGFVSFWFQIFSCSFQKRHVIIIFKKGRSRVSQATSGFYPLFLWSTGF